MKDARQLTPTTVYLPASELDELRELAARSGVPMARYLRRGLRVVLLMESDVDLRGQLVDAGLGHLASL